MPRQSKRERNHMAVQANEDIMSMMNEEGSHKKFGDKMLDLQQNNILNKMIRIQGDNYK